MTFAPQARFPKYYKKPSPETMKKNRETYLKLYKNNIDNIIIIFLNIEFIQNVKQYVKNNYRVTKKQMSALNKVYKRCSEDLFKGDDNDDD